MDKSKFKILVILLIGVLSVFIFESNLATEKKVVSVSFSNISGFFPLGAMENQIDYDHHYINEPFGMNLWHHYTGNHFDLSRSQYIPQGWSEDGLEQSDSLLSDFSSYWNSVKIFLDKEADYGMKMLLQRPKIEWLCYGQRSDYKCAPVNDDDYKWFYSFRNHETGIAVTDSGNKVMVCRRSSKWLVTDYPGFVIKRLKCNNEQLNDAGNTFNYYYHGDDSRFRWFIKPRIRIDSDFAHNNLQTPVCKIIIISSNGIDTLRNVVLKGINFTQTINQHLFYNGQYLEEYYNLSAKDSLAIRGVWGPAGSSRGNAANDETGMSKMDIQVFWYGNCDMWIDYVRVDNEVADGLFNPNSPIYNKYQQWLQWEGQNVGTYVPPNGFHPQWRFYIEEFEFNNIPCIAYVNKKLQYYSSLGGHDTVDLMTCFYWNQFTTQMPDQQRFQGNWTASGSKKLDADVVYSLLIKPTGMRQFFTEIYPFTASPNPSETYSVLPHTLPPPDDGCLYYSRQSTAEYDRYLQNQLDATPYPSFGPGDPGWWTNAIKIANNLSVNYGIPFITMLQSHLVHFPGIENRREPTNEEIKLITNLAISYGTKGIIYFWWGGAASCSTPGTCIGFTNANNDPRLKNYYGEPKWDSLIAIHKLITKWMPYLMSFDNRYTNSYIFRLVSERNDLTTQTYFSDVYSFTPLTNNINIPADTPENPDSRFIQAAVFKNSSEPNNKYFMLVNRRCSPYFSPGTDPRFPNGENGGRRFIKVSFKQGDLNQYQSWKIIDLGNNSVVANLNGYSGQPVDLGWFLPGEGKLYTLTPVM